MLRGLRATAAAKKCFLLQKRKTKKIEIINKYKKNSIIINQLNILKIVVSGVLSELKEKMNMEYNKQLYSTIINSIQFMNEVNIGDIILIEYLFYGNIVDINQLIISKINDINIVGDFESQTMPEIFVSGIIWSSDYFFNNLNNKHFNVYKKKIQTIEDIQNKLNTNNNLNQFIEEAKLRPVELNEVGISFIGEDYRYGRELFYQKNVCLNSL